MSRVLIVEDNLNDFELIRHIVAGKYEIAWVPTLTRAVEYLCQHCVDAVILDPGLPDSDSPSNSINAIEKHRGNAAVVVLSGSCAPEHLSPTLDGWIVKGSCMAKGVLYQLQRGIASSRKCSKVEEGIKHLNSYQI